MHPIVRGAVIRHSVLGMNWSSGPAIRRTVPPLAATISSTLLARMFKDHLLPEHALRTAADRRTSQGCRR